ncbi:hypothetical protein C9J03_01240 [Photobacterium gaetbulicola]|uniref:Outer membrane protein beta-barrel domain-containing protein n=1 Tax=Photobacterium gaetbulicola Gung47 TaxID=658445 RepID=A0A0C5WS36_9GAMM|nr:hypothetical protein [Photobacterium gaetbulicola]AJR05765.1 hypothetical protein H744_1c0740 [Photobacterium gaetbulicola Gung47]PSU14730.1 hypothetical protein C9J03_01240 [Photobacterium gaetbulicola]
MKKYGCFIVSATVLFTGSLAHAMDLDTLFRVPSVKLAIAKSNGNIDITKREEFNDIPFNSSNSVTPVISLMQSPYYFSESTRWGYHTELSASYFDLDYDDDDDDQFVGGNYKGYSVGLTPVLFYQFGDRKLCSTCKSWRFELGAGVHYINADGKLKNADNSQIDFDSSGFGFNSHLGAVLNYKNWELGLRIVAPTRLDDAGIKVEHGLSSISFGYRF